MKKLFLLLAMMGILATACESGSGIENENGNKTEQPDNGGNNYLTKQISAIQLKYSDDEYWEIYFNYDEEGRLIKISDDEEYHSWTYKENSIVALEYIKGDGECTTTCILNNDNYIKSYSCPFWEPDGCTVDLTYNASNHLVSTYYSVEGTHSANWQDGNLVQIQTPWGSNAYCSYNNVENRTNLDLNWFVTELLSAEIYTDLVGFDSYFTIVALAATGYTGKTNRNFLTQIKEIDGDETDIYNYTWKYDNNGYPISCHSGEDTITFYYN